MTSSVSASIVAQISRAHRLKKRILEQKSFYSTDINPASSPSPPTTTMAPQAQTTLTHVPFEGADKTRFVHIISNILTEDECNQIIKSHTDFVLSETTPGTIRYREGFDDPALANLIWKRIARFYEGERIQDEDGCWWTCIGLNDNMRLSKYEKCVFPLPPFYFISVRGVLI